MTQAEDVEVVGSVDKIVDTPGDRVSVRMKGQSISREYVDEMEEDACIPHKLELPNREASGS